MKIVLALQNLSVGGIQRLVVDDANELHRRGEDVWIVVFERPQGESMETELRIPKERIVHIEYPRMRSVSGFRATLRFLRSTRPDVVFTHHWFANTVGRIAGLFAGVRVIPFEHSDYSRVYSKKQLLVDRALQYLSPRIVAVSSTVRDSLVQRGISSGRITVVQNGIDLARFRLARKEHAGFTFVFVGRLVADKCVADILHALRDVPEARLTVTGSGPEEKTLRELAHSLGIGERVMWVGTRMHAPEVLASADCLVLPSRREGFGLAVIEALASGVPVIVSETANASGAVQNGVNGYIVPTGDVGALSSAMKRIANGPEHARLTHATRASIDTFSIQTHVSELLKVATDRRRN